jgi:hypothetical protein
MRKLPAVEEARALMTEAKAWSVMNWLKEKKRVRTAADKANSALDELNGAVKARWGDNVRAAYDRLPARARTTAEGSSPRSSTQKKSGGDADGIGQFVRQVKDADEAAAHARAEAERTFDEAERRMSTSLAREGCDKAILSWDLHEKAIRLAEH